MKILLACEESQAVCMEFRKKGHEAYSADLLECSGPHPEWHIQGDVLEIVKDKWDMMIAFPPCTHLAVSGARHFDKKRKDGRQKQGIDFFMKMIHAPISRIAVENPIGIMSTEHDKPTQIIQPYQFGDPYSKSTCLWLKNLPPLRYIKKKEILVESEYYNNRHSKKWENNKGEFEILDLLRADKGKEQKLPLKFLEDERLPMEVDKGEFVTFSSGKRMAKWYNEASGNGHLRSKTFPGIARAMADQWG